MILIPKRKILAGVAPNQVSEPKQMLEQIRRSAINTATMISKEAAIKWAMLLK